MSEIGGKIVLVQRRSHCQRELLDAEPASAHLLPAGGVVAILVQHRLSLSPDDLSADLSGCGGDGRVGRPTWSPPVTASAFHPTVLNYWRRTLAASTRPPRVFDAVLDMVATSGAIAEKNTTAPCSMTRWALRTRSPS